MNDEEILMEGWLRKECGNRLKLWRWRYFRLHVSEDVTLSWGTKKTKRAENRRLMLRGYEVLPIVEKKHGFQLIHSANSGMRNLRLQAKSAEEHHEWVESMSSALKRSRRARRKKIGRTHRKNSKSEPIAATNKSDERLKTDTERIRSGGEDNKSGAETYSRGTDTPPKILTKHDSGPLDETSVAKLSRHNTVHTLVNKLRSRQITHINRLLPISRTFSVPSLSSPMIRQCMEDEDDHHQYEYTLERKRSNSRRHAKVTEKTDYRNRKFHAATSARRRKKRADPVPVDNGRRRVSKTLRFESCEHDGDIEEEEDDDDADLSDRASSKRKQQDSLASIGENSLRRESGPKFDSPSVRTPRPLAMDIKLHVPMIGDASPLENVTNVRFRLDRPPSTHTLTPARPAKVTSSTSATLRVALGALFPHLPPVVHVVPPKGYLIRHALLDDMMRVTMPELSRKWRAHTDLALVLQRVLRCFEENPLRLVPSTLPLAARCRDLQRLKELLDLDETCRRVAHSPSANDGVKMKRRRRKHSLSDRDARGMTALHHASERGFAEIVRWLINSGASADTNDFFADRQGRTPLRLAIANGHAKVVRLLLAANAFDDTPTNMQDSIRLAREQRHCSVLLLLLRKAFDANVLPRPLLMQSEAELLALEVLDACLRHRKNLMNLSRLHRSVVEKHSELAVTLQQLCRGVTPASNAAGLLAEALGAVILARDSGKVFRLAGAEESGRTDKERCSNDGDSSSNSSIKRENDVRRRFVALAAANAVLAVRLPIRRAIARWIRMNRVVQPGTHLDALCRLASESLEQAVSLQHALEAFNNCASADSQQIRCVREILRSIHEAIRRALETESEAEHAFWQCPSAEMSCEFMHTSSLKVMSRGPRSSVAGGVSSSAHAGTFKHHRRFHSEPPSFKGPGDGLDATPSSAERRVRMRKAFNVKRFASPSFCVGEGHASRTLEELLDAVRDSDEIFGTSPAKRTPPPFTNFSAAVVPGGASKRPRSSSFTSSEDFGSSISPRLVLSDMLIDVLPSFVSCGARKKRSYFWVQVVASFGGVHQCSQWIRADQRRDSVRASFSQMIFEWSIDGPLHNFPSPLVFVTVIMCETSDPNRLPQSLNVANVTSSNRRSADLSPPSSPRRRRRNSPTFARKSALRYSFVGSAYVVVGTDDSDGDGAMRTFRLACCDPVDARSALVKAMAARDPQKSEHRRSSSVVLSLDEHSQYSGSGKVTIGLERIGTTQLCEQALRIVEVRTVHIKAGDSARYAPENFLGNAIRGRCFLCWEWQSGSPVDFEVDLSSRAAAQKKRVLQQQHQISHVGMLPCAVEDVVKSSGGRGSDLIPRLVWHNRGSKEIFVRFHCAIFSDREWDSQRSAASRRAVLLAPFEFPLSANIRHLSAVQSGVADAFRIVTLHGSGRKNTTAATIAPLSTSPLLCCDASFIRSLRPIVIPNDADRNDEMTSDDEYLWHVKVVRNGPRGIAVGVCTKPTGGDSTLQRIWVLKSSGYALELTKTGRGDAEEYRCVSIRRCCKSFSDSAWVGVKVCASDGSLSFTLNGRCIDRSFKIATGGIELYPVVIMSRLSEVWLKGVPISGSGASQTTALAHVPRTSSEPLKAEDALVSLKSLWHRLSDAPTWVAWVGVLMSYRESLESPQQLLPRQVVSTEQVAKDLCREILNVNGEIFRDHTGHTSHVVKLDALLLRVLERDAIGGVASDDVGAASSKTADADDVTLTSIELVEWLKQSATRTVSGYDSFAGAFSFFGFGDDVVLTPSHAVSNPPTEIFVSSSELRTVTYNNYDVLKRSVHQDSSGTISTHVYEPLLLKTIVTETLPLPASRRSTHEAVRVLRFQLPKDTSCLVSVAGGISKEDRVWFEGWMNLKIKTRSNNLIGYLSAKSKSGGKWKRRFCRLRTDRFEYYKTHLDRTPRGVWVLRPTTTLSPCQEDNMPYCIHMAMSERQSIFFSCATHSELDQWTGQLQGRIDARQRRSAEALLMNQGDLASNSSEFGVMASSRGHGSIGDCDVGSPPRHEPRRRSSSLDDFGARISSVSLSEPCSLHESNPQTPPSTATKSPSLLPLTPFVLSGGSGGGLGRASLRAAYRPAARETGLRARLNSAILGKSVQSDWKVPNVLRLEVGTPAFTDRSELLFESIPREIRGSIYLSFKTADSNADTDEFVTIRFDSTAILYVLIAASPHAETPTWLRTKFHPSGHARLSASMSDSKKLSDAPVAVTSPSVAVQPQQMRIWRSDLVYTTGSLTTLPASFGSGPYGIAVAMPLDVIDGSTKETSPKAAAASSKRNSPTRSSRVRLRSGASSSGTDDFASVPITDLIVEGEIPASVPDGGRLHRIA